MNYLTQNYKELFNSSGWKLIFVLIIKLPFLIKDIISSGKVIESLSFIFWEIRYCSIFTSKSNFVKFNSPKPIVFTINDDENLQLLNENQITAANKFNIEISLINWKILIIDLNSNIIGVTLQNNNTLIISKNRKDFNILHTFESPVEAIYQTKNGNLFICIKGKIYRTENQKDFEIALIFKYNKSIFRHDCGMTENAEGILFVGEYGSLWNENNRWEFLAYLHYSYDNGKSWHSTDFLRKADVNKHIHLVKYIKRLDLLVLTDGDNHKNLWKFDCQNKNNQFNTDWQKINRFHVQKGGFTSAIETESNVLFGSDYLGGTNFIIKTKDLKNFKSEVLPEPYKRNAISALVERKNQTNCEIWAEITSLENFSKSRGLIMYSEDHGNTWNKFIEFLGKYQDVTIISSSQNKSNEIFILIRPTDKTDTKSFTLRIY